MALSMDHVRKYYTETLKVTQDGLPFQLWEEPRAANDPSILCKELSGSSNDS